MTPEEARQDMLRHLDRMLPNTPPLAKPAPKARVKPLPPQRAACGVLMDGDRLPAHVVQCKPCEKAGGILQVSIDGQTWVNYSGTVEGVDVYSPHIRCIIPTGSPPPLVIPASAQIKPDTTPGIVRVAPPTCVGARRIPGFLCFGPRAMRHPPRGKPPVLLCEGHYLHAEANLNTEHVTNVLDNPKYPERLDHRPPPLTHSYGIEDPALPDA